MGEGGNDNGGGCVGGYSAAAAGDASGEVVTGRSQILAEWVIWMGMGQG